MGDGEKIRGLRATCLIADDLFLSCMGPATRPTVEINPGVTELSDIVDIALPMKAADALQAIWDQADLKPN